MYRGTHTHKYSLERIIFAYFPHQLCNPQCEETSCLTKRYAVATGGRDQGVESFMYHSLLQTTAQKMLPHADNLLSEKNSAVSKIMHYDHFSVSS